MSRDDRRRNRAGLRLAAVMAAASLALSACTGPDAGEAADGASPSSRPGASTPAESTEPTPPSEALQRAQAVQAAQQALSGDGSGRFTVELVRGRPRGVLPRVEGAYDFSVPAGSFTAVTEEADRTVRLRYRTRGGRAWSQVLYPGSPLAPDCWYQIALPGDSLALPAQVAALLFLQPRPDLPPPGDGAEGIAVSVELVDVLNAVGLTRLANLLDAETAAAPVAVRAVLEGAEGEQRFSAWTVDGDAVLSAFAETTPSQAAVRELAAVRGAVAAAAWRISLAPGDAGGFAAPPADRVLVAGDVCS